MKSFKYLIFIFLPIVFVLLATCNNEQNVDCFQCKQDKPVYNNLIIYSTINKENPVIPVIVYNKIFDASHPLNNILLKDTLKFGTQKIKVAVGNFYSVVALYRVGIDTVAAVDGVNLSITKVKAVCDKPCWIVSDSQINVRLKFTKLN